MSAPPSGRSCAGEPEPAARCIVLVGFMGAGKTRVGGLLAARLGWRFVDLDARIERAEGRRVAEIFAASGEARFRQLEAHHTAELAGADRLVLAPGGGWIADPANVASLGAGAVVVWLRVALDEALRRTAASGEARPLLAADDHERTAAALLRSREPLYARARLAVDTDGRRPADIAREIEATLRRLGLLPGR